MPYNVIYLVPNKREISESRPSWVGSCQTCVNAPDQVEAMMIVWPPAFVSLSKKGELRMVEPAGRC